MRHRIIGRRLGRDCQHRLALRRNLVSSLFEHETVSTTIEKAKEVKPFAEKLITLARKGTLAARRQAISVLNNRRIVKDVDGKEVSGGTVIGKLFSEIGPRYLDRPGGYTRIIKLSKRRLGDNGELCLLQLVGKEDEAPTKTPKKKAAAKKGGKKAPKAKKDMDQKEKLLPADVTA
jgi:large subunit ribosomal protein L17